MKPVPAFFMDNKFVLASVFRVDLRSRMFVHCYKKIKKDTSELLSSHQSSIKATQPCVIIDSKTIKDRRLETLVNIYQQNINPMWNWNRQGNVKIIDICVAKKHTVGSYKTCL